MSLILASSSPRRKKLLSAWISGFDVKSPEIEEPIFQYHPPHSTVINAIAKADCVSCEYPDSLVIGADTVLEFQGQILGKPKNIANAKEILAQLSGKEHLVVTAVCLARRRPEVRCVFVETTLVKFIKIDKAQINKYCDLVNTLDKAGAYALQEYGEMIIERVEGEKENVIGLPKKKLLAALQALETI